MAARTIAVVAGSPAAKAIVLGGAFATGMAMTQLVKAKPTWGMPMTLALGAGGVAGAMYLDGAWGELSMGIAAASAATLGASLPGLIGGSTSTGRRAAAPVALPAGRRAGMPVAYDWRDSQPIKPVF
ncbi:MAG: hypothetical protein WC455_21965 [Dehalococcoidia bacterium]|jgi:hypothetical protein